MAKFVISNKVIIGLYGYP